MCSVTPVTHRKARMRSLLIMSACILLMTPTLRANSADEILKASGIKGGLIVHIGCGDGKRTAALCENDSFIVQGLDTNPLEVTAAREHIKSIGCYGKATVAVFDGTTLPYADNLVTLVVVDDQSGQASGVKRGLLRVLAPGGVAIASLGAACIPDPKCNIGGGFVRFYKTRSTGNRRVDSLPSRPRQQCRGKRLSGRPAAQTPVERRSPLGSQSPVHLKSRGHGLRERKIVLRV